MAKHPFLLAGHWKMNLDRAASIALAGGCVELAKRSPALDVAIYPDSFVTAEIARTHGDSPLLIGAQNCHEEAKGAFTGEISAMQWASSGVSRVLIGHSERRHVFGESLDQIAKKVIAAREAGLKITLCVGEQLDEREAGRAEVIVGEQLAALTGLDPEERQAVEIAYEPVWAIGTGKTATPEIAEAMHKHIRRALNALRGCENARVLYGGSVKPANARELAEQDHVDGFLVGGASLEIESFAGIAKAVV